MHDLDALFRVVDELEPNELKQLNNYIQQRRRTTWWVVPPNNLNQVKAIMRPVQAAAEAMSEDEINAVIDEAIDEVRRERNQGGN